MDDLREASKLATLPQGSQGDAALPLAADLVPVDAGIRVHKRMHILLIYPEATLGIRRRNSERASE